MDFVCLLENARWIYWNNALGHQQVQSVFFLSSNHAKCSPKLDHQKKGRAGDPYSS